MILNIFWILLGFLLLIKGGDYLVDGAVALAKKSHLSPMVIGLTVVGFGTSAPELLVSTQSAMAGISGIALGNVVGSNIANIALILGVTAILCPIAAQKVTLRIDMPFLIIASAAFVGVAMTGTIERWHGILGLLILLGFLTWQIKTCKDDSDDDDEPVMPIWKALVFVVCSIAALVYGADVLIKGASGVAMTLGTQFGVPAQEMERIIGLTIVSIGTSFPELFASVMAARKKETDMAIGNIIGSNTFNILCIVGVASAVTPIENSNAGFLTDYIIMVSLTVLLWFFLRTKNLLERWEGVVLLLIYVAFIVSMFFR